MADLVAVVMVLADLVVEDQEIRVILDPLTLVAVEVDIEVDMVVEDLVDLVLLLLLTLYNYYGDSKI